MISEKSGSFIASADLNRAGPDYFTFYTCEVKELVSQNEDSLHVDSKLTKHRSGNVNGNAKIEPSGSFFSNNVGEGLSNQKRETLNALLRQSVATLTPEVDEILDPVLSMRQLQSLIRRRKLRSDDTDKIANGGTKRETCNKRTKTLPSSSIGITIPTRPVSSGSCKEGDDDLQFLLETDISLAEEAVKKYSDKLFITLGHMEKQLEELLGAVVSTCRPMNASEKQHLKKLIQKLPPKNLNRVVEIVQRSKLEETQCSDEIFVDLDRKDNATLWRLYYYTEAVNKARKLSFQMKKTMVHDIK